MTKALLEAMPPRATILLVVVPFMLLLAEVTVAVSDICGFLLAPNGDTSTRACGRTDAWPFQGTASDSVGRTVAGHDSLPRLKAEGLVELGRKRARAVLTMR